MESIIERITRQHFWQFHGGIHPPEQKTLTNSKPIRQLPLPEQLIIPLQQHIGRQGNLLVAKGDNVLKGQALTQSDNPMAVPIHAPTSGTITEIKKSTIAHPSGLSEICLFLQPDGDDRWKKREICQDFRQLDHQTLIKKIAEAGIAGMGGAGFPTHIKVNIKPEINFLIINAAECEPYITADDLLIREHSAAIIDGINILGHLLTPAFILIGIEDNKPEAAQALINASKNNDKIHVCVLPTLYPSGGEKQLIKILTGKEVNSGALPVHSGIVVQNIATCFAIADAVINDTPLIRRVVTVTGQAIKKPQNVWALLGTPVDFLLKQCGFNKEKKSITDTSAPLPLIMGGPMMGFSINNDQVPIVKTSNCILAPSEQEMPSAFANKSQEVECIRCGQCSDVCPSQLLPQELQWSAKAKDYEQLKKLNLQDCIDCGACAYVCPSQIPLVQYYRVAKAEIRQQQLLDIKAEQAKTRFEARKLRLEKEKTARELKHKQAAAARKEKLSKNPEEATSAKSAVAAALARVRAKKKAQATGSATPATTSTKTKTKTANDISKQNITATVINNDLPTDLPSDLPSDSPSKAIDNVNVDNGGAAHGNMSSKQSRTGQNSDVENKETITPVNDKKAKIALAIARAKAKKQEKAVAIRNSDSVNDTNTPVANNLTTVETENKIVNADVNTQTSTDTSTEAVINVNSDAENKANKVSSTETPSTPLIEDDAALTKKKRIAVAVAKAKEKAQQRAKEKQDAIASKALPEKPTVQDKSKNATSTKQTSNNQHEST